MKRSTLLLLLAAVWLLSCQKKQPIDLLVVNATLYTVDAAFSVTEAMAVHNGKVLRTGSTKELTQLYQPATLIDAEGKAVYPGFHDAHCHFYGLGQKLQICDLVGTTSFAEILERLKAFRQANPKAAWLMGRGWDQNDWAEKEYPTKAELDVLFPDVPVKLERIDGHALLCNQKALDLANVTGKTTVAGGEIILANGQPTGVLVDNAASLVENVVPSPSEAELTAMLIEAEKACFAVGLTTLTEAGLPKSVIGHIRKMQQSGALNIRIDAMAQPTDSAYWFEQGFINDPLLKVNSFKVYADGALGSRGACLLQPYHDVPTTSGFLLSTQAELDKFMTDAASKNFQVNTHCIGDSANRMVLTIYEKLLQGKKDHRWRIEHAQVVNPADVAQFGRNGIIPSVQPTHATSDMYWADERLGPDRISHAYAYRQLLEQNGWLPLGSDFPVEDINPVFGFHAAVARQDANNFPEEGFQPENALPREQALRGMTIWAAKGAFWENEIGSLEAGKAADFVISDRDLMGADKELLRSTKVIGTFVSGKQVY